MGSSLPSILAEIFISHFEERLIASKNHHISKVCICTDTDRQGKNKTHYIVLTIKERIICIFTSLNYIKNLMLTLKIG